LVLVGTGLPDLYPLVRTPLGNQPFLFETEVIAQAVSMIEENRELYRIPGAWVTVFLVLVMLLFSAILFYFGLVPVLSAFILFAAGFYLLNASLFAFYNLELPFITPLTILFVCQIGLMVHHLIRERFILLETRLQLKQTKIDFLTNELHSHHLFNELTRLSVMIRQNPALAREYLVEFADMLRASLKYGDQEKVKLQEQINYLKAYIRQQEIIYGDKLLFQLESKGECDLVEAPWHIFYPLLENAVKYSEEYLRVTGKESALIQALLVRQGSFLDFTVSNPFRKDVHPKHSTKTGLRNLQERLAWSYPEGGFSLNIDKSKIQEEWSVTLRIPAPD